MQYRRHDLESLIPTLQNIKDLTGPQFLHVVTRKGQGYKLAEADPVLYHGPGKFDPSVGIKKAAGAGAPSYTQVFVDWVCEMAAADPRLVAITPAMREGSGLVRYSQAYPARYFDVGIAEQHAVTFAAGLACEGMRPVVAIYSTFLQRAYDQLVHDVAQQNLPVVFALDRAGLVGGDGATHCGAFDIAYLRCVPHMSLIAPADEAECRRALTSADGRLPVEDRRSDGLHPLTRQHELGGHAGPDLHVHGRGDRGERVRDPASGDWTTINATAAIPAGASDPYVNTASVSCTVPGFPNTLTASDDHSVNLFQAAIDLTKIGDALSKVGDPVDYVITLENNSSGGSRRR